MTPQEIREKALAQIQSEIKAARADLDNFPVQYNTPATNAVIHLCSAVELLADLVRAQA